VFGFLAIAIISDVWYEAHLFSKSRQICNKGEIALLYQRGWVKFPGSLNEEVLLFIPPDAVQKH
jgi:hypothetical protein